MNNFGVIEIASAKTTNAPGWAYVPDTTKADPNHLQQHGQQQQQRKRARKSQAAALSYADVDARQAAKVRRDLEALQREGGSTGRDSGASHIPIPPKKPGSGVASSSSNSGSHNNNTSKHTSNARRILQSQKTFANHLDDYLALQAQAESNPNPAAAASAAAAAYLDTQAPRAAAADFAAATNEAKKAALRGPAEPEGPEKQKADAQEQGQGQDKEQDQEKPGEGKDEGKNKDQSGVDVEMRDVNDDRNETENDKGEEVKAIAKVAERQTRQRPTRSSANRPAPAPDPPSSSSKAAKKKTDHDKEEAEEETEKEKDQAAAAAKKKKKHSQQDSKNPTAATSMYISPSAQPRPPAHPRDDDPLLQAGCNPSSRPYPPLPPDTELRALLEHPPLDYLEARAVWPAGMDEAAEQQQKQQAMEDDDEGGEGGEAASKQQQQQYQRLQRALRAEGRPRYPPRTFCEVCGYWGRVKCTRCGARVCALDCLEAHREECIARYGL